MCVCVVCVCMCIFVCKAFANVIFCYIILESAIQNVSKQERKNPGNLFVDIIVFDSDSDIKCNVLNKCYGRRFHAETTSTPSCPRRLQGASPVCPGGLALLLAGAKIKEKQENSFAEGYIQTTARAV